jgi:hypothetical protein
MQVTRYTYALQEGSRLITMGYLRFSGLCGNATLSDLLFAWLTFYMERHQFIFSIDQ